MLWTLSYGLTPLSCDCAEPKLKGIPAATCISC